MPTFYSGFDWYALMHLRERLIRLMIDSTGLTLKEFYKDTFGGRGFVQFQQKLRDPLEFKLWELRTLARGINKHNPYIVVTWMNIIDIVTHDLNQAEQVHTEAALKVRDKAVRLDKARKEKLERRLGESYDGMIETHKDE